MTTVIQGLLPVIDSARQVAADLGARPYRVYVRVRTWAGPNIGDGAKTDVDTEITPRPRVAQQYQDSGVFDQEASQGGLQTSARLRISKISGQLTLANLLPTLTALQQMYYVVTPADGGDLQQPAMFAVSRGPFRKTTEWVVELVKTEAT